jgi:hypothetical protein
VNGKIVGGFLVLTGLTAGAVLYYLEVYGYYHALPASAPAAQIKLTTLGGATEAMMASDFEGIEGETSPLKFRGCFVTPMSLAMLTETFEPYESPTPLIAPSWFTCFDAERIGADLEAGNAVAFLSEKNIHPGVDRVVAVYPDGRAYAWQQLNESADQ